jgi:hypothetical protein
VHFNIVIAGHSQHFNNFTNGVFLPLRPINYFSYGFFARFGFFKFVQRNKNIEGQLIALRNQKGKMCRYFNNTHE